MDKQNKGKFVKKDKEEWDLNTLKLRLKEIRKLTQVEVEVADVWETSMWMS